MAARPKSGISIDTDVNLDFLTKEEKEALLSKKMDMIRQRNKALTERHQLIEADKKKAEEAGQAVKPTVDSQMLPAEGAPKPRGRGRGQPYNKDSNRPMKERPKSSGDLRDSSHYEPIVDTTDLANYRSKGHGGLYEREAPNNIQKNKKKSKEEATVYSSNFEYEPIIEMKDLDKRFGPLLNLSEARIWPRIDHGPPPDPSFNPLADRRRSDKKEDIVDHRRHPRNYGGTADLTRVKQNMKNMREKEKERPQGTKPLDMVMTGKERRNHEDWKAERERYDKERIQRQMNDGGNWKRAWDADKISIENEEQSSYSLKMEPAKRPAGRIGSGRFDRGERDEHPRSTVLVKGALQHTDHVPQQQWQHHDQQQLPAQLHQHHPLAGENKPSRGRGRGRGRGRSRGGSGEKFPRPRTWSGGDDRFVECQKELLLVKFDNTAGDNSVEVEYDDDEFLPSPPNTTKAPQPATTQGRGPTGRTPNQASKPQARGGKPQQQKSKTSRHKDNPQTNAQQIPTEGKWNNSATPQTIDQVVAAYDTDEIPVRASSNSQSFGEGEDWEDDTESSVVQEENDSGISGMGLSSTTTSSPIHDLHLECRLNPEAPEFLPSSPDLIQTSAGLANTSAWNSGSRSSSPLSQDSATSPQLTLSPPPNTHSATQFHESSAQLPLLRKKVDTVLKSEHTVLKSEQSSPLPRDELHLLERKKTDVDDHCSSEVPTLKQKSSEIINVNASCLTSNGSGTKDTTLSSNAVDRANALSDASSEVKKEALESNKVALSQEKTTTGHISASLPKRMTHNSLSDNSKNLSREPATSLAAECTQDIVVDRADLSDASSKVKKEALKSSKVALSQEKTTTGHISASLPKRMTHNSLSDDSKNLSREPATSLAAECTQDIVVDRADLSDASSKFKKEALESSKVALSQEKTTTGHISASLPKRMTHNSLSDDSKNLSRESATSHAAECTQDIVVAKDLTRDVSKVHDSSEGTSESVTNGDGSDKQKLNGVSAVSENHVSSTREHEVAAGSLKKGSNIQEDHKEPAATTAAHIIGPSDSTQASELDGSLNTPKADESTLPTADVSAFS